MREESVLLVVSQYLGSQRAAADVQAAHSRVELAQALYDQAADLQKNGVGTGIDTLRSNVQLQNEKQRLIVARTQLETSLYGLARLLNVDPKQRVELADAVSFFDTPEVNARSDPRTRLPGSPRAARDPRPGAARPAGNCVPPTDARMPRVSFTGFWAQQGLNSSNAIPVYSYQGNLDVPLFTGGRIQAERAKAELAIRQLKQQEQEVRNRIVLDVQDRRSRKWPARAVKWRSPGWASNWRARKWTSRATVFRRASPTTWK